MTARSALAIAVVCVATTLGASTSVADKPERLLLVVNADNKMRNLDASSVKNIYLGQMTFWGNDVRIKPYNRVHDGAAGKPFFRDVLGMSPSRFRHHWQKLELSGQGVEPEIVGSAQSLVAKVGASSGAIGYILESEAGAADSRVRLIPIGE